MRLVNESAVLVVDAEGVIRFWSEGAEQLLGHGPAAAIGSTLDLVVPSEFRQRHWDGFRRAIETGKSYIDGAAAVLPVVCGDGAVRKFAARLSLIRDPADRVVGAMATYTEASNVRQPLPTLGA
jgi:PAS domain S-box-containing protein